ncbi:hypothetical protein TAMA11512_03340 [Selenomonas sp. TAMA-11512]|uniref:hypothetical protein n=1 Tax=Selenomonas sp. TAMA-11512 TaxID=3095337 RepID=UPI0030872C25|nr:hypothetical protein TAMA11512_03340 [Selenomonas sp. TAMA-11512]
MRKEPLTLRTREDLSVTDDAFSRMQKRLSADRRHIDHMDSDLEVLDEQLFAIDRQIASMDAQFADMSGHCGKLGGYLSALEADTAEAQKITEELRRRTIHIAQRMDAIIESGEPCLDDSGYPLKEEYLHAGRTDPVK